MVNVPSFVRTDSEKHIDYAVPSPFGQGRPGLCRASRRQKASGGDGGGDEDED